MSGRPPNAARNTYRPVVESATAAPAGSDGTCLQATSGVVLGAEGAGLLAAVLVGRVLEQRGHLHLGTPPLSGTLRQTVPWAGLLLPAAVAAALVAGAPRVAPRLGPVGLPAATAVAAAAWATSLALVDGPAAVAAPLSSRHDYLADVDRVGDVPAFLASFAEQVVRGPGVEAWTTHVAGHPPGALLMFWAADRLGLEEPGWAAALLIAAGASAAAAVIVAVRALAGPRAAASAAPLLALAPYALWVATSADAAFLAASAWGAALVTLSVRGRGAAADAAGVAGGVLLGTGLYLSYGLVPFGAVVVALLIAGGAARFPRAVLLTAAGVLLVVVAYSAVGFWWPDGLAATRIRWAQGWGSERPPVYSALANLAVAGLATGPAALAGLPRLRALPGRLALPVAGAVMAVLLADVSGLSRGEVERIWLPFLPWLLVAGVALARDGRVPRGWLVSQAAVALVVTAVVRTTW
jgi:methylthioxylose transferase